MALSDLFPYGAPELVEGAAPRMTRSLVGAALMVTSFVVGGGALVSRAAATAPSEVNAPDTTFVVDLVPLPADPEPPGGSRPGGAPAGSFERAVPVPAPEATPGLLDRFSELALPEATWGDAPAADLPAGGDRPPGWTPPGSRDGTAAVWEHVDTMPELISCREPRYPELAREAGSEGHVRVLMRVGTDGQVREVRSVGEAAPMFEAAALEAARSCRFRPARSNGRPVSVWVSRLYEFRVH